jgi:F0F1-type ATP synthase assembly protein I
MLKAHALQRWRLALSLRAMLNPLKWKLEDQVGLLVSTISGAGLGIVIGYVPGKWLGTLIWALISAVILGGAFYLNRPFR